MELKLILIFLTLSIQVHETANQAMMESSSDDEYEDAYDTLPIPPKQSGNKVYYLVN